MLDREDKRADPAYWSASSPHGIVASAHYRATAAGVEILSQGGNAIDAAIAVSLALGVVESAGSGLGGMTMMMIYHADSNRTFALEGHCRAPRTATPEEAGKYPRQVGYKAIAVPTNAAVLDYALSRYGTMLPAQVIQPAIELAEKGYLITPFQNYHTEEYRRRLKKHSARRFHLDENLKPYPVGTIFQQPELAWTLRHLAQYGFQDFYTGTIARLIVEDMEKNGGFIIKDDLADIPYPAEREPLWGQWRSWNIATLPPPGGGTALLQMLSLFEVMKPNSFDHNTPDASLLFAAIIQRTRQDRRTYRLEPEEMPDLTSIEYAQSVAPTLQSKLIGDGETSHVCIMDRHRNVVSMTQSIERSFGAAVASEKLGFIYNGYMKAFKIKNKRHPHYLQPGAVARSNASPTIVLKNGESLVAMGSTGSERMVSGIFQTLVRLRYQTPFQALQSPRLHCTPEGDIFLELQRFPSGTQELLEQHGFTVHPYDAWSFQVGGLQLATYDGELFRGVGEVRRDGAAAGPDEDPEQTKITENSL